MVVVEEEAAATAAEAPGRILQTLLVVVGQM